ncbi:MAG: LPS export ABC transporter permease LptG [Deltaproteobacteria bacterium]|nr:LPS export ABC transporter permease LptG [Deltaproteobacteria bacterium]
MKTIEKYVLKEFLKILVLTVGGMTALFLVIDLVEKSDELLKHGFTAALTLKYLAFKVPSFLTLTMPIALLLSAFISTALLNKHGEISAMKAGGIRLTRVLVPLFIAAAVISVAVIILNERVIPFTEGAATVMMEEKEGKELAFGSRGVWFKSGEVIYNVKKIDVEKQSLEGITAYSIKKPFSLEAVATFEKATWTGSTWKASGKTTAWKVKNGAPSALKADAALLSGVKNPSEFAKAEKGIEAMGYKELKRYIRSLKRGGYDTTAHKVELQSKLSFPFVNLVMLIIGIPLALKTGRGAGMAAGVALSLAIGFAFWVVFGLCKSLGMEGAVPPVVAAWFTPVLFLSIGALMFSYVKQ